jgi:hypothetical protein
VSFVPAGRVIICKVFATSLSESTFRKAIAAGNAERRLQRVVENRIARAVGKIGENDGVFLGQAVRAGDGGWAAT